MGEPARALQHSEAGQSLYNVERHRAHVLTFGGHDPGACARYVMGWAAWLLGYPDRAKASADEAVHLAEQLGHPFSLMIALLSGQNVNKFSWLSSVAATEPSGVAERADCIGIFSNTVTERTCSNV